MQLALKLKVESMLEDTFGKYPESYEAGYYDGMLAFAKALGNVIPEGLLLDALKAAIVDVTSQ